MPWGRCTSSSSNRGWSDLNGLLGPRRRWLRQTAYERFELGVVDGVPGDVSASIGDRHLDNTVSIAMSHRRVIHHGHGTDGYAPCPPSGEPNRTSDDALSVRTSFKLTSPRYRRGG